MRNQYATHRYEDDGPPTWRPQSGEVLTGVIDRYTVSETPQGFVRTVIVTEERTGEQVSLQLASTSLLALFAQHQPHPGERIDVRYRWHAPGHDYQRWKLRMDRPEPLDFSPLGGEASDEAPWHRERRVAMTPAGSTQHLQEAVGTRSSSTCGRQRNGPAMGSGASMTFRPRNWPCCKRNWPGGCASGPHELTGSGLTWGTVRARAIPGALRRPEEAAGARLTRGDRRWAMRQVEGHDRSATMAKRSRQTFQKHQKAHARQQKQQQKAARRLQARQRRADAASALGKSPLEIADRRAGPPPAPGQGDHVSE